MSEEYKEKSIEEIIDYLLNEEIGYIECDYEKVDLLLNCIKEKSKEIERLNNIINELENKLLELRLTDVDGKTIVYRLLDKLQELKGSDK